MEHFLYKRPSIPIQKSSVFQNMERDVCVIKLFQRFKMLFRQAYRQN